MTTDLNAMHEAELKLQHFGFFADTLADVMGVPRNSISLIRATAAQRAEAYAKVKGIYHEN